MCVRLERESGPKPTVAAIAVETVPGEVAQLDSRHAGKRYDPERGILRKSSVSGAPAAHCEWAFDSKALERRLVDLVTGHFVDDLNVLLIGPTGAGNSHLSRAIGERVCRAGRSVVFVFGARDAVDSARVTRRPGP